MSRLGFLAGELGRGGRRGNGISTMYLVDRRRMAGAVRLGSDEFEISHLEVWRLESWLGKGGGGKGQRKHVKETTYVGCTFRRWEETRLGRYFVGIEFQFSQAHRVSYPSANYIQSSPYLTSSWSKLNYRAASQPTASAE